MIPPSSYPKSTAASSSPPKRNSPATTVATCEPASILFACIKSARETTAAEKLLATGESKPDADLPRADFAATITSEQFMNAAVDVLLDRACGRAGLSDFGPDGWQEMVCVETANALANAVTLDAGASHAMSATYGVEDGG